MGRGKKPEEGSVRRHPLSRLYYDINSGRVKPRPRSPEAAQELERINEGLRAALEAAGALPTPKPATGPDRSLAKNPSPPDLPRARVCNTTKRPAHPNSRLILASSIPIPYNNSPTHSLQGLLLLDNMLSSLRRMYSDFIPGDARFEMPDSRGEGFTIHTVAGMFIVTASYSCSQPIPLIEDPCGNREVYFTSAQSTRALVSTQHLVERIRDHESRGTDPSITDGYSVNRQQSSARYSIAMKLPIRSGQTLEYELRFPQQTPTGQAGLSIIHPQSRKSTLNTSSVATSFTTDEFHDHMRAETHIMNMIQENLSMLDRFLTSYTKKY